MPAADAARLRAVFHAREQTVEGAHSGYRAAQDAVRGALRTEPFNLANLKTAMAATRAARQRLDEVLQDVIAAGQKEGSIRADLPKKLATKALFGILDQMVTSWTLGRKDYDVGNLAEPVVDLFLRGASARGGR